MILLLLTLAYGLTGYLLPWDNRAYWGTVVTTQIGATVPVMGPYVSRLLASTGDIGVVTFARFYGLHVLLLPPATLLLIAFHVYLVRRHGVAPAPGDEAKPKKSFFPEQVFKDTVAVFIAFAILFVMAIAVRVPLERMADPTDTSYIPRPEWYFLFPLPDAEGVRRAARSGRHRGAADSRDSGADSDAVHRSRQDGARTPAHSGLRYRRAGWARMGLD